MAVGDRCMVTGDKGDLDHEFEVGTEVTLLRLHALNPWWRCADILGFEWWVHSLDLEHVNEPEPSDEEIKALFGITPPSPCPTCGRT